MNISGLNLFPHQTKHLEEKLASDVPEKRPNRATDNLAGSPPTGHKNKFIETGRKKLLSLFIKGEATKKFTNNPMAAFHWQKEDALLGADLNEGPVLSPEGLLINKQVVRRLALSLHKALDNALPEVPTKISDQKDKLSKAFFEIYASAYPLKTDSSKKLPTETEVTLAVREGFAGAEKVLKKLATELGKKGNVAGAIEYMKLAESCANWEQSASAVKARPIQDAVPKQKVKGMENIAPALNRAKSGAIPKHVEENPPSDDATEKVLTNQATDNLAGSVPTDHKNKSGDTGGKKWASIFKKRKAAKTSPNNPIAALNWKKEKALPASFTSGPVFRLEDLSIDRPLLRSLVVSLDNALPEVPEVPKVSPGVSENFFRQKENLSKAFFEIYASAYPLHTDFSKKHDPAAVTEGTLALAVRDGFADAAKSAKKLAAALSNEGHVAEAEKYSALAKLCVELKRAHLSAGAPHILDEFAKQEVTKIEKIVPGLNRAESGAIIEKSKGASFWVKGGQLFRLKLGGGFSKTDTLLVDDDKDLNYWTLYNGHFKVGLKEKVTKIFAKRDGSSGSGKIGATFGPTYKETATLPEMVKMTAVREADNSFAWSAGRMRRKRDRWMRGLEKSMANPIRLIQRSKNIPLYLSQRKVAKGAFNQDVMALFAEKFDGDKNGALTTLIKGAYPSATTSLAAKETLMSPMTYVPRPPEPAGATGYRPGREGWAHKAFDMGVELSKELETRDPNGGKLKASIEAEGERRRFDLERLKGSHAFLDIAYNKDREEPIRLFREMENAENHDDRLHLYREVNELISPRSAGDVPADRANAWPAAFLKTRTSENPQETLAKVEKACALLEEKYLQLIEVAPKLRAARTHSNVDYLKDDIEAAFETISKEIWNSQHPSGSGKQPRLPKKTKQITTLLAQSYDAASLALGAIGLHLTILKNEALAKSHSNDQGLTDSINNANQAYKRVRELLDSVFLPISHDQLMRHSTIASPGISRKTEAKVALRVRAGAKLNFWEDAAHKLSKIPVLNWLDLGGGTMAVEVNNGLGTAFLDLAAKYTYSEHPNLGRCGHFLDINVTGGIQAPLLKEAMEKIPALLEKLIKKVNLKKTGVDKEKTADADKNIRMMIEKKLGPWMKTVARETYMEGGSGITGVQMRFHAFPNTLGSSKTLGFEWQYTRITKEELATLNATITARSGGIENLGGEVNVQTGQRTATPRLEFMGGDLSYHMMQFPGLDKILSSASTNEERKKLLDENPFVKSQFFSTEAILKIVKSHAKFLKSIEEGAVKKHYGFSMYHDEKYKKFLESAAEQAFYAGNGDVDPEKVPESIYKRMTKQYASDDAIWHAKAKLWQDLYIRRTGISPITGERISDMDESEKPSEVDVRVDYFLNNPEGQEILDAYCNILRTYREANASLMVNEGYQLTLREPGTAKKTVGGQPDKPEFGGSEFETKFDTESEYSTTSETSVSDTESEYDTEFESVPGSPMHAAPVPETPMSEATPETSMSETAPKTISKVGGENKKILSEISENVMRSQLTRIGKQSKPASSNSASSTDLSVALTENPSRSHPSNGNIKIKSQLNAFDKRNAKESGFKKGAAEGLTAAVYLPR